MIQISVDQRAIASLQKRIYQLSGTPLAKQLQEAMKQALGMLVGPIRARAPRPGHEMAPADAKGTLAASVQVWTLRKRAGEVAAYAVGPRGGRSKTKAVAPHRHLVILGHKMVGHKPGKVDTGSRTRANPFVEEAVRPLEAGIEHYIGERVTAL